MDFYEKAQALVARMTLAEKASLLSGLNSWHLKGVERLGIPSIMVCDGPHGLRKVLPDKDNLDLSDSVPATCFPTAATTACSFDRALLSDVGKAIGEECREEDVSVILGPGMNTKRSPLCGRNFEYFSEDPMLSGELAAAMIEGVQSQRVGVSLKHFAANNQETRRMTTDVVADERTLRELYFAGFERAIKQSKPWTVMCSYNKINGTYAADNRWLLTEVLRDEWGYGGLVVSDWGAEDDRVAGVLAGLDLEMPYVGPENDQKIVSAVEAGTLSETDVDRCAARVVTLILKAGERQHMEYDRTAHHALARRAAAESAVLLKNDGALLPLRQGASLAVVGAFATVPRYQGAGSSKIVPNTLDTFCGELEKSGVAFDYAAGYRLEADRPDAALIDEACRLARGKDAVLVFAGLPDRYESEGFDRKRLDMPESHVALIHALRAVNENIAVVLAGGSVIDLGWENDARAILMAYLSGEAGAGAVADLVTGAKNPSGKLAESWPMTLSDTPCYRYFPGNYRTVEYRESVFVGYRYYDAAEKPARYAFGHGLSYTAFAYGDLCLSTDRITEDETLSVSCTVENTGDRAGAEIVQLYVAPKVSGVFRPVQELRGFEKVFLAPGEKRTVDFRLEKRDFACFNTAAHDWCVESGAYEIRVSASSRDRRLSAMVEVAAKEATPFPDDRAVAPCYYDMKNGVRVPDEQFAALLGRPIPAGETPKGAPCTRNSTMEEMQDRFMGRLLSRIFRAIVKRMFRGNDNMMTLAMSSLLESPLRTLGMFGNLTERQIDGIVMLLNGKLLTGVKMLTL